MFTRLPAYGAATSPVCAPTSATLLSTTDVELYEASRAVAGVQSFRAFMGEIGHAQLEPSWIQCDNAGAVLKTSAAKSNKRNLYMRRRTTYVQEATTEGDIRMASIDTKDNRADILTKMIGTIAHFVQLRGMIQGEFLKNTFNNMIHAISKRT